MSTTVMRSAAGYGTRPDPYDPGAEPSSADEINHRIANSLQLLSALVSIDARGISDPAARAVLDLVRHRIGAIAKVHRHLYRSHDASTLDLGTYLEELGRELQEGCVNENMGRSIIVDADPVSVSSEDAAAVGIIVSELVSNACKYAYLPEQEGSIRIMLRGMPFGGYGLQIEDRGLGRSASGIPQGSGLGGRLIDQMVAKLGGRFEYRDARPGTRFALAVGRLRAA